MKVSSLNRFKNTFVKLSVYDSEGKVVNISEGKNAKVEDITERVITIEYEDGKLENYKIDDIASIGPVEDYPVMDEEDKMI
ncbi:MAG: hypothetical protein QGF74_01155, partial [Candidatus Nanoarchaeia archaeon]|nr:hypothetical protein [Candidatus Nanoarchaeia archaeon]